MRRTSSDRVAMSWISDTGLLDMALYSIAFTHLQDVTSFVGNEQDVKLLKRLIDESHIGRLDGGMLRVDGDELGEGGEQAVYSRSRDGSELPGQECWDVSGHERVHGMASRTFPTPGADGSCQDDLV